MDGEDMAKTREMFEAEQAQNRVDGETVLGVADAYNLPISQ